MTVKVASYLEPKEVANLSLTDRDSYFDLKSTGTLYKVKQKHTEACLFKKVEMEKFMNHKQDTLLRGDLDDGFTL